MRWPKKREIIIYFLLYKKFGTNKFNIGEAFDLLKPYFSKKIVLSSLRYMNKVGLITKLSEYDYRVSKFEEYISLIIYEYLELRKKRKRKHNYSSS
jgi:hypothetical protein